MDCWDRSFETLLCASPSPGVLVITLNRADAANALNSQMARDLLTLFSGINLDPAGLRCIVLTGAGARHFCGGGDLKERDGFTDQAWLAQHVLFEHVFAAIMECPLPIIAAVNGAAFGGGCEFALACDFIFASDSARFAQPETKLGIIPGGGGTQNLPRAIGVARAKEMIMTGRVLDATEALAWGLINRLVPSAALIPDTLETARAIAAGAPIAIKMAKLAIGNGSEVDRRTGLAIEIAAYNQTVPTEDRREGIRAAIERRDPDFKGR